MSAPLVWYMYTTQYFYESCMTVYGPYVGWSKYTWFDGAICLRLSTRLQEKILRIIDSATDTELVDLCMRDVLPRGSYIRFNPYTSYPYSLDEIDPKKFATINYCTESPTLLHYIFLRCEIFVFSLDENAFLF